MSDAPTLRRVRAYADERVACRSVRAVAYTFDVVPLDGELRLTDDAFNKICRDGLVRSCR